MAALLQGNIGARNPCVSSAEDCLYMENYSSDNNEGQFHVISNVPIEQASAASVNTRSTIIGNTTEEKQKVYQKQLQDMCIAIRHL